MQELNVLLTSPPVLAYPDFGKHLCCTLMPARKAWVLFSSKKKMMESFHPVAYASRTLTEHEKYGITDLERLSVVWAVRHFRAYLLGNKYKLKALLNTCHPSGKMARWSATIAELDLEICYKPGRKNTNADALSRSPVSGSELGDEEFDPLQVAAVTTRSRS